MGRVRLLGPAQRATLLAIARESLEALVRNANNVKNLEPETRPNVDAELREHRGAFVTLTRAGELRGCVGYSEPVLPLVDVVSECARAAGSEDSRFPPVRAEEVLEIRISISVLSPLEEIRSPDEIEVGRHGLLVRKGQRKGLLLPQVAAERGWDVATFLNETSRKAGMPADDWRSPGAFIFAFEAEVFQEEEF